MSDSEGFFFSDADDELEIEISPGGRSDDPCSETSVAPSPVPSDLDIVVSTKRGWQRIVNEDFPVWCADPANTVFRLLVADGIGGSPRGELASHQLGLAVQESQSDAGEPPLRWIENVFYLAATKIVAATDLIREQIDELRARIIADLAFNTVDPVQLTSEIANLVDEAQRDRKLLEAINAHNAVEIFKRLTQEMIALDTVGTAAVLALVRKEALGAWGIHVGNLGDPKAYLFHAGVLQVLTTEHSRYGCWVRKQGVTGAALTARIAALTVDELCKMQRQVTSWLGRRLNGDLMACNEVKVQPPFVLILCSDGVWKYTSEERILDQCKRCSGATELCEALMNESQFSSDDRSVVVAWGK